MTDPIREAFEKEFGKYPDEDDKLMYKEAWTSWQGEGCAQDASRQVRSLRVVFWEGRMAHDQKAGLILMFVGLVIVIVFGFPHKRHKQHDEPIWGVVEPNAEGYFDMEADVQYKMTIELGTCKPNNWCEGKITKLEKQQ